MDNPEKLATKGTQDEEKQNKNTKTLRNIIGQKTKKTSNTDPIQTGDGLRYSRMVNSSCLCFQLPPHIAVTRWKTAVLPVHKVQNLNILLCF